LLAGLVVFFSPCGSALPGWVLVVAVIVVHR